MGLFSKKKGITSEQHEELEKIRTDRAIKRLPLMYIITVIFGLAFSLLAYDIIKTPEHDLLNASALILEGVFGLIIAWTVYVYSKKWNNDNKIQQKQIAELILEIKAIESRQQNIIEEQMDKSKKRNEYVIKQIRYKISFASDIAVSAVQLRKCLSIQNVEERTREIEEAIENLPYAIDELKNIQDLTNLYADDIEPEDIRMILSVAKYGQILSKFIHEEPEYLANVLENFENKCKVFFTKFSFVDWVSNQEVLD